MASQALFFLLFALAVVSVQCNSEGDALNVWKSQLGDPYNVLQSWDPTLVNPCTWFHITCNNENSVVRVDLGNAGLSGPLVPELGMLRNLEYLEVSRNNLSGPIPSEIGNLTNLFSLDLDHNQLTGSIPPTLGNLKFLRYLRLNDNQLTGKAPIQLIQLILSGNLQIMSCHYNGDTRRVGLRRTDC
ncbi:hypothetical protein RJ640_030906 [Escallonia rubra]|uniref:Leucine-rich repeat-containing N-terminal plant-type domain-containing protein n=1 Tax=Escallonia rubra TaxID=112253 RepID=A0AA88UQF1_9ASTE|nr:hypothetical protein RJ640_030906 [Escallonia rubra]